MVLQDLQKDFKGSNWKREIDVRDFIQANYEPYNGDESFLTGPSEKTKKLWSILSDLFEVEREKGVYDAETKLPQSLDTYGAGYIDKDSEVVVGLQTDAPLKRGIFPKGGIRMVEKALQAYGYELDPATKTIFTKYRKTHNEGVFSAYNDDIKAARHAHIITGLPDAYGRGASSATTAVLPSMAPPTSSRRRSAISSASTSRSSLRRLCATARRSASRCRP